MDILVIGGNRFVGYFLTEKLIREGHAITLLNRGSRKGIFPVHEIFIDRNNTSKLRNLLSGKSFDAVYDMCAYYPKQTSVVIDVFKENIQQFVHFSTVAVYDKNAPLPFTENSERGGNNVFGSYGKNKSKCEDLLFAAYKKGFPVTILRPTYIYGPRDYTGRVDVLVQKLNSGATITIPENDPSVQFVYALDVAEAFFKSLGNKHVGEAYNICGEEIISYSDFVKLVGKILGKTPKLSFSSITDFPFEDWEMYCDVSKSKKGLGLSYTSLEQGLRKTLTS